MAYDRPEDRFLEILGKQLVRDLGYEKAFDLAKKAREQAKLESGDKQPPAVSTRFLKSLMELKPDEPIRVLQEDQKHEQK